MEKQTNVRLTEKMIKRIDKYAELMQVKRASAMRMLMYKELENQLGSDIIAEPLGLGSELNKEMER